MNRRIIQSLYENCISVCRGRPARAQGGHLGREITIFEGGTPSIRAGQRPATRFHTGFQRTVLFLVVILTASTGWAQRSSKTRSISSVGTGMSIGNSSVKTFNYYSAGSSSYGNLYSAPQGGGALGSSIQKINQRASRAAGASAPASAFGSSPIGSSRGTTRNIASGALKPVGFKAMSATPAAGAAGAVLAGPNAAPSMTSEQSSSALLAGDTDSEANLPVLAAYSGQAYAAVFPSSQDTQDANEKDDQPLTTLLPKSGGSRRYRQMLREGEEAFRQEDYRQAARAFKIAYEISSGSSESLLSLVHVHFATARNEYNVPSLYLQRALKDVPELPLIPVYPRDFYGNVGTFVKDMIRLEEYAKAKPHDANAQFILAYMKWREKKPNEAAGALRRAMENCKNNDNLADAIETFWKAMVYSGAVTGTLEEKTASGNTDLLPTIPSNTTEPILPNP